MALGGVLRAALRAGDWARAAAESRRQARALRSFSPEFGERSSRGAGEFLRSRGVQSPDDMFQVVVPPWTVSEGFSNRAPLRFPLGEEGLPIAFSSRTARGNALYIDPNTGRRLAVNPDMLRPGYSDIASPYEGFRALPGLVDDSGMTALAPAPWQGRGQGPMWGTGQWSNFGGSPRSGFVSGYDELGEVLYPSPVPMEQIYRDDRWWYPQFRNPDRSIPKAFRGR